MSSNNAGAEQSTTAAPLAVIGVVRALDGDELVVEATGALSSTAIVTLPAVLHAAYAEGDRVLVVFQGADTEAGVVAGRIANPADRFDAHAFVRADGARALDADWDIGADRQLVAEALRARDGEGLLLADDAGDAGVFIAQGGNVGIGHATPTGQLHVWDGSAGHLFTGLHAIGAGAQLLLAAGAVAAYLRAEVIITNGAQRAYLSFTLQVGGATTQNFTLGSDIYQVRLNGDGSLDVRRTAGSNPGALVIRIMWL